MFSRSGESMNDDRFLTAFFARRRKVCGRLLEPFSLRHRVTLEAINSPLLIPGEKVSHSDLVAACRICSIRDPLVALKDIEFRDWWEGVKLRRRPGYSERQFTEWNEYLNEFSSRPKIFSKGKSVGDKGLHYSLAIVSSLVEAGFPEERAWTMPEGLAVWYSTARSLREGADIEILTTETEDQLDEFDQLVEQAEEEFSGKFEEIKRTMPR